MPNLLRHLVDLQSYAPRRESPIPVPPSTITIIPSEGTIPHISKEKERNRIRDNQRRSRARKKEYVQEIEQRLRQRQLQGVEASAEVQQAARRVADENHKLRQLLQHVGYGDEVVEQYIQTGKLGSPSHRGLHTPNTSGSLVPEKATETLEGLLIPRRPSCLDIQMPILPTSRHTSPDRTLSYGPTPDSPVEEYGSPSESVHQIHASAAVSPTDFGSQQVYARAGDMKNRDYAGHHHRPLTVEWANTHQNQSTHGISSNIQGFGANQTLDYHPPFPGINPSAGMLPPTCGGPPSVPYIAYQTFHPQPPAFIAAATSHIEHVSVVEADPAMEDRKPQYRGHPDDHSWQYNTRHN
ncbi:hypothetical protein BDP81DRAFT_482240 [Colletotrichum phormii]|uniref:BZIP domain-containing protein n=1 Tax=Colletotrichum phormii TaxID=359342 RepID=A0AAJ0EDX4_9PEZI|nr:uncharacterized protein BDP81DRAFT_482240 [Colletotrichum phormii]KAK1635183.1 hypothetical protein BDP81DRAFT_482240 [Colletotrichum phormii]